MTELGALSGAVDVAVAVILASPGWADGVLTIPGGTALGVSVFVMVDEQPSAGRVRRHDATILCAIAECLDEPVDGTTIVVGSTTWTVRTALEQTRFWRMTAWANG